MVVDSISDLIARIKNASVRLKATVEVPDTNISKSILAILKQENYVGNFEVKDKNLVVNLVYSENKPVITQFIRMSKPGLRVYLSYKDMPRVLNGLGVGIYSTSKGIMTGEQAKKEKLGGEYLCRIW